MTTRTMLKALLFLVAAVEAYGRAGAYVIVGQVMSRANLSDPEEFRTITQYLEEKGWISEADAGFRLATLNNSTRQVGEAQIDNSGLREYFEQTLSADIAQRLKLAPEPYRMAAESLGVELGEIRLVAAHGWDIAGALRAGCAAAFVDRPGKALFPTAPPPDIVGTDLREVADRIVATEGG